jgi:tRNA (guanine-N7-)-methyltransferase
LQPYTATPQWLAAPPLPLEVEFGIGNGLALYHRAAANPAMCFLGAEVYLNGLRTLLRHMRENPLPNLKIFAGDARTLLAPGVLAPAARFCVFFPDPWPKSGHHKRRLVQPQLAQGIAKNLVPGGEFWVVTDWPDYAYHTISVLYHTIGLQLAPAGLAAADCKPSARIEDTIGPQLLSTAPAWWVPTKYQEKAAIAGRNPWFIKAIKVTSSA